MVTDSGKGDLPRPMAVPYDEFAENWDRAFKKVKSPDVKSETIIRNNITSSKNDNVWIDDG